MENQNRSTFQTGDNNAQQQPTYGSSNNQFNSDSQNAMNKEYDQCDCQKGVLSIAAKVVPITVYICAYPLSYLLFKLVSDEHLGLFILTVVLLSMDFWVTKNILGRKLAGLRWFTVLDQNDEQKWCFQSCKPNRITAKVNILFFWFPQVVSIIFWFVIIIINFITLSLFWVALAVFACFLLILNFILFAECKGEHQEKLNSVSKKFGVKAFGKEESL